MPIGSRVADFSPLDIPGCKLWLRADQGFTLVPSGTFNVASAWNDLSGAGNHCTQATANRQPIWVPRDVRFGGQPSMQPGTTDTFSINSANVVIVSQPDTVYICCFANAPASSNINLIDGQGSRIIISRTSTSKWQLQELNAISAATTQPDGLAALCALGNGTQSALFYQNSKDALVTGDAGTNPWTGAHVGSQGSGANGTYAIAELIAYNGLHSAPQRAQVFGYFASRYKGAFV
jgi:hypothetical protein